jgi:hypothetical protein
VWLEAAFDAWHEQEVGSGASRRKGLDQGEFSDLSHTFGLGEDRGSGETDVRSTRAMC